VCDEDGPYTVVHFLKQSHRKHGYKSFTGRGGKERKGNERMAGNLGDLQ
jgi:hypothetical protein